MDGSRSEAIPCLCAQLMAAFLLCQMAVAADFRVDSFGAVADGRTDSTKGIQAAVDAASRAGGGVVILPAAAAPYLIRGTLVIRAGGVELSGEGATLRLADGAISSPGMPVILAEGTEEAPIRKVTLRGLAVDANYFNQVRGRGSKAVVFRLVEDALVENVSITRSYVGLSFRRCRNARARRVTVTDYQEDGLDAGGDADEVSGGKASEITFSAIVVRDAPRAARDGNAFEIEDGAESVTIEDSRVEGVGGNGIGLRNHASPGRINHSLGIQLRNVIVRRTGGDYAIFGRAATRDQSAGNSFRDVRLVNVTAEGPVAFWGPLRNLELQGGQYGDLLLGFESVSAPARAATALAEARIRHLQARAIRINGASEKVVLTGVSASSIDHLGVAGAGAGPGPRDAPVSAP